MSKINAHKKAILIAAALFLLPVAGNQLTMASAAEQTVAHINVTGQGSVSIAPDIATLDMGVLSEADTASNALKDNNDKMAIIISAMKEAGITSKDLQTSGFQIQPKYVYDNPKQGEEQKPPRIVGYTVSNNISVLVRNLEKVGEILDRSIQLGINNGGNIQFGNDNPKDAISKARTAAMIDAKDRAETLLTAAGAKLGKIIEINESLSMPRPVPMAKGRMMADVAMAESVPVEGGENSYFVTVSVSWEIQQ